MHTTAQINLEGIMLMIVTRHKGSHIIQLRLFEMRTDISIDIESRLLVT